jgi:hypothetical protein
MMRAHSGFPLDDDIIDVLLATVDDFKTLLSFMMASKAIYNVYKRHPVSIRQAVTVNQTGPAIAQALALLRTKWNTNCRSKGVPIDERSIFSEAVRLNEVHNLVKNAKVVYELEDLYSWRYPSAPMTSSCSRNDFHAGTKIPQSIGVNSQWKNHGAFIEPYTDIGHSVLSSALTPTTKMSRRLLQTTKALGNTSICRH